MLKCQLRKAFAVPVFIHNLATAVPPTEYRQEFLRDVMLHEFQGKRRTQNLIQRIYDASGIERRHTVVRDLDDSPDQPLFFHLDPGAPVPTTAYRNAIYIDASQELAVRVGQSLLARNESFTAADITHVITVSCTGFFAPGTAYALVKALDLAPSTHRYNIGFMGCFAAFQALQMAQAFCTANPDAVVMLICVEICSIHLHLDAQPDNLISASVFADGAAGAIVSASPPAVSPYYRLGSFTTAVSEKGEEDMAWSVGDFGFDMVLSRYVPSILETSLPVALEPLRPLVGNLANVHHWAVHPGGRAILDKVEQGLELHPEQLASSRHVLAQYGNMSSATVLFVLSHLLSQPAAANEETVVAMAFGPGITIESGVLTRTAD